MTKETGYGICYGILITVFVILLAIVIHGVWNRSIDSKVSEKIEIINVEKNRLINHLATCEVQLESLEKAIPQKQAESEQAPR